MPLDDLGADYDYDDMHPVGANGLSVDGKLYAVPFYGESSFTFYRKDLFEKAGLKMPDKPTWDQIAEYAAQAHRQVEGAVRHLPARQARLGREHGASSARWRTPSAAAGSTRTGSRSSTSRAVEERDQLLRQEHEGRTARPAPPPTASTRTWRCSRPATARMWIDATSAAGYIYNPKESQVADKVGFRAGADRR